MGFKSSCTRSEEFLRADMSLQGGLSIENLVEMAKNGNSMFGVSPIKTYSSASPSPLTNTSNISSGWFSSTASSASTMSDGSLQTKTSIFSSLSRSTSEESSSSSC